jgi:hypothetical protein
VDSHGRTIFVADAYRDGQRFIVRADEKLTAFMELESACAGGKSYFINVPDDQHLITLKYKSFMFHISYGPH